MIPNFSINVINNVAITSSNSGVENFLALSGNFTYSRDGTDFTDYDKIFTYIGFGLLDSSLWEIEIGRNSTSDNYTTKLYNNGILKSTSVLYKYGIDYNYSSSRYCDRCLIQIKSGNDILFENLFINEHYSSTYITSVMFCKFNTPIENNTNNDFSRVSTYSKFRKIPFDFNMTGPYPSNSIQGSVYAIPICFYDTSLNFSGYICDETSIYVLKNNINTNNYISFDDGVNINIANKNFITFHNGETDSQFLIRIS